MSLNYSQFSTYHANASVREKKMREAEETPQNSNKSIDKLLTDKFIN